MRVLADLGIGLKELGAHEAARLAFEIVVKSRTSFLVRTNAILELMELESSSGNRMAFERRRAEAEKVRERMPPSMQVDLRLKAGLGLARFGQMARSRQLLTEGLQLSEKHGLNAWYFRFEKTLANLAEEDTPEPGFATPQELDQLPAVRAVAIGLREYAASAS